MSDKKDKLVRESNEIVAGDFTFVYKNGFAAWRAKLFSSSSIKDRAKDLMAAHYAFYGQLEDEEYVTAGSTLKCSCGTEPIKIELKIDHGVEAPNGKAVLTCQDCDTDINNIKNFGSCNCEVSKYDILPHPTKLSETEEDTGKGKYRCFPILDREWIAQAKDSSNYIVESDETLLELLEKSAVLICQYGGMITIEEVEEKEEEEEEEVRTTIRIAPWLRAYPGEPTRGGGTSIDLQEEARKELKKVNSKADWYAYEGKINQYVDDQYEAAGKIDEYHPIETVKDGYINQVNDRYWVAVGPEILCQNYNNMHSATEQTLSENQFKYGTEIDVVLQWTSKENREDFPEIVYIECIVGDVKGHTYPDGVFHTGKPYPFCDHTPKETQNLIKKAIGTASDADTVAAILAAITGDAAADEAVKANEAVKVATQAYAKRIVVGDGSYIEFIGGERENDKMSKYSVKEIIVYEREW